MYLPRSLCDVLEDIRKLMLTAHRDTWVNTSKVVLSLVEEVQVMGNRMEAALTYVRDIDSLHRTRSKLIKEIRELRHESTSANEDADYLED